MNQRERQKLNEDLKNKEIVSDVSETQEQGEEKISLWKELLSWVEIIVVAVLISLFLTKVVLVNALVPSSSMETLISPGDRLFGKQPDTFLCTFSGFLGMLEQKADVFIRLSFVYFQCKSGQSGTVSVMSAFVAKFRIAGEIGKFAGFRNRESIKISAECEGIRIWIRGTVKGIEPVAAVRQLQLRIFL